MDEFLTLRFNGLYYNMIKNIAETGGGWEIVGLSSPNPWHYRIRYGGQAAADLHCIAFQCLWTKRTKPCKLNLCRVSLAEREAS